MTLRVLLIIAIGSNLISLHSFASKPPKVQFIDVTSSYDTVCGRTASGDLYCTPPGYGGNYGNGDITRYLRKQTYPYVHQWDLFVAVGAYDSCGVKNGAVKCHGWAPEFYEKKLNLWRMGKLEKKVVEISGKAFRVAVKYSDGTIGLSDRGYKQWGTVKIDDQEAFFNLHKAIKVDWTLTFVCGLLNNRTLACRGGAAPDFGKLENVIDFAASSNNACAATKEKIECRYGSEGEFASYELPIKETAKMIATSNGYCAIASNGMVSCWESGSRSAYTLPYSFDVLNGGAGYFCGVRNRTIECFGGTDPFRYTPKVLPETALVKVWQ